MTRNVICGWPLTIEYHAGKIFWTDYCTYRIESIDINGSNYSIIVDSNYNHFVTFSYGIAKFGKMLYWTQPAQIYSVDLNPGSLITMVYSSTSSQHLRSVHVVHPLQQPRGKYACWKLKIWFWPLHILTHSRQSKPWSQLKSGIFGLEPSVFSLSSYSPHTMCVLGSVSACMYVHPQSIPRFQCMKWPDVDNGITNFLSHCQASWLR